MEKHNRQILRAVTEPNAREFSGISGRRELRACSDCGRGEQGDFDRGKLEGYGDGYHDRSANSHHAKNHSAAWWKGYNNGYTEGKASYHFDGNPGGSPE